MSPRTASLPLLAIVLLAAGVETAHAGAWPLPKGSVEIIATASYADLESVIDGRIEPLALGLDKIEFSPLISYGLTDRVTLSLQPFVQRLSAEQVDGGEESTAGFQDAEAAVRVQLWRGSQTVVSLQPLLRFPLGYDTEAQPALGSGTVDLELRGMIGHSWSLSGRDAFVEGQFGYRRRLGGPADEARLDLTFGIRPTPRWLLLAQSFNAVTVNEPAAGFLPVRRYKAQASVVRALSGPWSVQVAGGKAIGGRNAGGETYGTVALWWQR